MPNADYPKSPSEVVETLAEIFREHGRRDILEILENVHAQFDFISYDNWNGGTSNWALRLQLAAPLFATYEPTIGSIESEIFSKVSYLNRLNPNNPVHEVTLTPIASGKLARGERMATSTTEASRLWPAGRFRLFLSHLAKHKVEVSELKKELNLFGITGFVAHEEVQPTKEWQHEIELALRSMHGLLALITPEFHESNWTDQEIGWALGRGILVVPVRLGSDPYGFTGKVQGVSGSLQQPKPLAKAVFETLLENPMTHGEIRRAFSKTFCESTSYQHSLLLRDYIPQINDFTDEEKTAMKLACSSNSQLANAHRVPEIVHKSFGGLPQDPPAY